MEETRLIDEIRKLNENLENNKYKSKKFRLPSKAKINKSKLREGYVTVAIINENKNIDFTKLPIIDSTIKIEDTFHSISEEDLFIYKGKPFIFQPKNKINPYNPLRGPNETYGQKYVMARIEGDKLTTRRGMSTALIIGILVIGGIILYTLFGGG